jgi:hypothetical protein
MAKSKITWQTADESKTKKCGFAKDCDKSAVGVVSALMFHSYVCREHAKLAEEKGLVIDYDNWRL